MSNRSGSPNQFELPSPWPAPDLSPEEIKANEATRPLREVVDGRTITTTAWLASAPPALQTALHHMLANPDFQVPSSLRYVLPAFQRALDDALTDVGCTVPALLLVPLVARFPHGSVTHDWEDDSYADDGSYLRIFTEGMVAAILDCLGVSVSSPTAADREILLFGHELGHFDELAVMQASSTSTDISVFANLDQNEIKEFGLEAMAGVSAPELDEAGNKRIQVFFALLNVSLRYLARII